jgi:hypothetical protein
MAPTLALDRGVLLGAYVVLVAMAGNGGPALAVVRVLEAERVGPVTGVIPVEGGAQAVGAGPGIHGCGEIAGMVGGCKGSESVDNLKTSF